MTETTEFSTMGRGVQRLWWLVAGLGLVGGAVAAAITAFMTPTYQAMTSILVGDTLNASLVDTRSMKAAETVAQAYADIIPRRPVMEGVVTTLKLPTTWQQLAAQTRVERPASDPQLIVVTVEAASPQQAEAIAGAVANQLLAVSSSRAAAEKRAFVARQLTSLQGKIQTADARLADLQKLRAGAKTPLDRQDLQQQIAVAEKTIADWQRNYADLAALRPPDSASTSMEILEKAHASPTPASPRTNRTVLVSVALGIMLAIPVTFLLERRRVPTAHPQAGPPEQAGTGHPVPGDQPELPASRPTAATPAGVRRRSNGQLPSPRTHSPRLGVVAGRRRVRV